MFKSYYIQIWGEGMVLQSKTGKTFGFIKHLPPSKGTSGSRGPKFVNVNAFVSVL